MFRLSGSEFINFELVRILSTAPSGGCEIGEFLEACQQARGGSPSRWHAAWQTAGERAEAVAVEAQSRGDVALARGARLRASNYFRASQYMMFQHELPRIMPIYERSLANFDAALGLLECSVHRLAIPYTDETGAMYTLPGILYLPAQAKRLSGGPAGGAGKIPVVVNTCGADSSQQEHYFMFPAAGVELGYAVLTFEGPGQGVMLRKNGLPFRPDWEVVTGAVLDELFRADERLSLGLDLDRVAIVGASLGGYFALRGASDPRVSACVSIDPLYSLWDFVRDRLPPGLAALRGNGWMSDAFLDSIARFARHFSGFQTRWEFENSTWMFGVKEPSQMFRRTMQFVLQEKDGSNFLHRLTCPVMITGAGQSLYFKLHNTTERIHAQLINVKEEDKEVWAPEQAALGGLQAKMGAFGLVQMKTFAFLDDKFGIKRHSLI
jgi:pimeloyl-ACP methyl ester carboxylesterase